MVVKWLEILPFVKKVPGSPPSLGPFWVEMFAVHKKVFCRYSC